jgi:hypothetical protein
MGLVKKGNIKKFFGFSLLFFHHQHFLYTKTLPENLEDFSLFDFIQKKTHIG